MNRIFISYSKNRDERALLFWALRDHGLNPWRDVDELDLGDDTSDVIAMEIANCSGAILWINEDFFASAYIADVELPAIRRAWEKGDFRIVPVFDGIAPNEAAERLSRSGIEIGDSNGHVVNRDLRADVVAAQIAGRYARSHVRDARQRGFDPVVRLVSYDDTAALRDRAVLNFDWRHRLGDDALDAANRDRLRSALTVATAALKAAYGACTVTVAAKSHLPLAVALGHAFAEPTGCQLRMIRDGSTFVTSRSASAEVEPLAVVPAAKGPAGLGTAAVEISVARDITAGVDAYVGDGNRYLTRRRLSPVGGVGRTAMTGPESASVWAWQVAEEITRLTDGPDVDRVDLFLATTVELAVLVGWWTNAAGVIHLMNWTGKQGPYRSMWTLP